MDVKTEIQQAEARRAQLVEDLDKATKVTQLAAIYPGAALIAAGDIRRIHDELHDVQQKLANLVRLSQG